MSDDTDRTARRAGRSITVTAFGDTVTELELSALDEARGFFGADEHLEIVPSYKVFPVRSSGSLAADANGRKYQASMEVRIVES